MHCVRLARTGLPVCENSCVIALQRLLNEMVDLALIIDLVLRALLIEDIIEVELPIDLAVLDLDFPLLSAGPDAVVGIAALQFRLEEGPDAYGCLDLAHLIILIADNGYHQACFLVRSPKMELPTRTLVEWWRICIRRSLLLIRNRRTSPCLVRNHRG